VRREGKLALLQRETSREDGDGVLINLISCFNLDCNCYTQWLVNNLLAGWWSVKASRFVIFK